MGSGRLETIPRMARATRKQAVPRTMINHWCVKIWPCSAFSSLTLRQSKRRRTSQAAKAHVESDSELSDEPLAHRPRPAVKKPPKATAAQIGESSDSDTPLGVKLAKEKAQIEKAAEKEAKAIRKEEKKAA